MTIHTKPLYRFLMALGLIATLAACGSGGGEDNKDSTPAPFNIPAVTDAAVSTEVISSPVPLLDFNQDVDISITNGYYSIAGGPYTKDKGTISSGKSVTVKVTTSASTNTLVEAVLTVGGVSDSFKVTTFLNVVPKISGAFTPASGVVPKSENTSNEITVQDIDKAVDITVVGGKYAIGSGEFTDAKGTVSKNQTVKLRGVAAFTTDTSSKVSVTIGIEGKGAVTREYTITTLKDTVAPTAHILFPPPVSMTEGNSILVRGSADDYNTITSVKVNGVAVTPKAAGDFSTWQVTVPLTASTDNDLIVTTEDSAGNKSSTQSQPAAKVMVRQGDRNNAFPDDDVKSKYQGGLVIDKFNGRNRLLVAQSDPDRIVAVDLATGKRSVFADSLHASCPFVIEPGTQRLYGCDGSM